MKAKTLLATILSFCAIAVAQNPVPKSLAILKQQKGQPPTVEIYLSEKDKPTGAPSGSLFVTQDDITKELSVVPATVPKPFDQFAIPFPPAELADARTQSAAYEVTLVFDTKNKEGTVFRRRLTLPVIGMLNATLERLSTECNGDNNIRLHILTPEPVMAGGVNDLNAIRAWFMGFNSNWGALGSFVVTPKDGKVKTYGIIGGNVLAVTGRSLSACLQLDARLPNDEFRADFTFKDPKTVPPAMPLSVNTEELTGTTAIKFPEDAEKDSPEKWKLEKNLDFGAAVLSSVTDEDVAATPTSAATTIRKRSTAGVFDLAVQFPSLLTPVQRVNKWAHYLTPFIKAAVSTKKIDKDTLSQNRILFGLMGESRYRQRLESGSLLGFHRIEWGITHASDRDFKQKEIYASLNYKPVFDALYKPYKLNWTAVGGEREYAGYGFTFEPNIGFDFGRTYSRRNPAEAVKIAPTIRRLNVGLKLGVDLGQRVSLTGEDTFYIRWEDPSHKERNHFKAQGDFKLSRFSRERVAQSIFVIFEKGWAPPFTGQQVNSFRIGYRIVGNFCDVYCR